MVPAGMSQQHDQSNQDLGDSEQQPHPDLQEDQAPEDNARESEAEDDDIFDFGKAKMEFFKQRAR